MENTLFSPSVLFDAINQISLQAANAKFVVAQVDLAVLDGHLAPRIVCNFDVAQ